MIAPGVAFTLETRFWPLVVVGFRGTLTPSSGDVSVFLPLEQAMLAETTCDRSRTAVFAVYSLVGSLVAAAGALAAGVPELLSTALAMRLATALQAMFALYALLGLATNYLYRRLPLRLDRPGGAAQEGLSPSRRSQCQQSA